MTRDLYHSALDKELAVEGELSFYQQGKSYAFVHDMTAGTHELFHEANAIYSEPSWQKGYKIFLQRAGAEESAYIDYLRSIRSTIEELGVPAILATGKHALSILEPDWARPAQLHKFKTGCLIAGFNISDPGSGSANDALRFLVQNYGIVADFSCGYGNLAKVAVEEGQPFIASDINPKCIYTVAVNYMDYQA